MNARQRKRQKTRALKQHFYPGCYVYVTSGDWIPTIFCVESVISRKRICVTGQPEKYLHVSFSANAEELRKVPLQDLVFERLKGDR